MGARSVCVTKSGRSPASDQTRRADDQRNADLLFVHERPLIGQSVFAERVAMIRGVDHHGVIQVPGGVEHAAELSVRLLDQLQIKGAVPQPVLGGKLARLPALILVDVFLLLGRFAARSRRSLAGGFTPGRGSIVFRTFGME